jgi:hypothetical protein
MCGGVDQVEETNSGFTPWEACGRKEPEYNAADDALQESM